jgi:Uri superfamily endonuclease
VNSSKKNKIQSSFWRKLKLPHIYSRVVPVKGVYCLCIENHCEQSIHVGALDEIEFNRGYYIYVGSALNSLIPRLKRHLKMSLGEHKKNHWHIDYFLNKPLVEIKSIYILQTKENLECTIAKKINEYGKPISRFGCSDCRCKSHLYKVHSFNLLEKIGMKKWIKDSLRLPE